MSVGEWQTATSSGQMLFWWQCRVEHHPQPDPVPSPASPDEHLPERAVVELEALWCALGWHHRHQKFLVGLKLIFPPS